MTSREYLEALGEALSTLVPDRERSETLRYYEEYFEEAGPEREAELMEELGSPEDWPERSPGRAVSPVDRRNPRQSAI